MRFGREKRPASEAARRPVSGWSCEAVLAAVCLLRMGHSRGREEERKMRLTSRKSTI